MTDGYIIDCTGDCVAGDYIKFERAVFTGKYPNAKFSHNEILEGEILSDSYGREKQQHTFTILLKSGVKIRIKGRNLYKNGVKRKLWPAEKEREHALNEKHARGNFARIERDIRKGF